MTDQEMERALAKALDHAAPNDLSDVLSHCGVGKGTVIRMTDVKKTTRHWRPLIAAVLALVLLGGGAGGLIWRQANAVASIVSLDVNPSIELKVSRSEKVLACTPMNEDAAAILFDMGGGQDLKGTKLDVAVNAIVGSLLRNGYLDDLASAILISVEDGDQDRAAHLQEELVSIVDNILQGANNSSSVYSQAITQDAMPDLQTLQNQGSMSSGKAALVSRVMAMNGTSQSDTATLQALSALSVEELMDLLEAGETRIPIGISAAATAAEEYAGTTALDSVTTDADPELEDVNPHYDVDIHTQFGEFEYRVDAFTGEVLSGPKNIVSQASGGSSQSGNQGSGQTGSQSGNQGSGQTGTQGSSQGGTQGSSQGGTQSSGQTGTASGDIGVEAAKSAALKHAGVASGNANFIKAQKDVDNGRSEYDIEFVAGGTKYEYEIDAASGSVLKSEREAVNQTGGQSTGTTAADIGVEAAKNAAYQHAGVSSSEVNLIKAQLDYDDGRAEYDIEFTAGGWKYDYEVLAADGTVVTAEKEQIPQSSTGSTGSSGTGGTSGDIGLEAAKKTALSHAGLSAGQVSGLKAEADWDDGRLEYEVEFRSGNYEYEYTIDGTSGAILQHEKDWDD